MVALDQVVLPLSIDMPNAVEVWIISVIDLSYDASIAVRLIGHDCHRSMQAHTFDGLFEKGLGGFCISPRRKAEIHHLPVCVDGAP